MAYTDMNDFLRRYFRQMHANSMPPEVLARLQDDFKKGILTATQQEWVEKYFDVVDGKLKEKPLPSTTSLDELSKPQAEKLYKGFTIALAGMKSDINTYKTATEQSAIDFVKDWVDERKVFSIPKATAETEASINNILVKLLQNSPYADQIKQAIVDNAKTSKEDKVFADVPALNTFLNDKAKNYNSNADVQSKLKSIASALYVYLNSQTYEGKTETETEKIKQAIAPYDRDLMQIMGDEAFHKIDISEKDLETFRKDHLPILFDKLYKDKTVRDKFRAKDTYKIVEQIEDKSENNVNWQDKNSDNYIRPKYEDQLTPLQQLEKWAGDTYGDTLKKYEELRGQHLFFGAHAKEICKAIDKEGVKPADGLKGLLEKKEKIKKRFSNKTLDEHFDWFTSTMEELSPQIPKAIEGCWKDAKQMKCVIEKIILKATEPKANEADFEKAKTAMEIMTVMKYGMMTSKVMDAMRKEEFSMFSDGKLSWNKNEGIQFVTKAFDKTVKAAFLGVGYGVTIARNKIMMRNMEFSQENNNNGPLGKRAKAFKDKLRDEKAYVSDNTRRLNREDGIRIARNNKILADLGDRTNRDYIDSTNIATKKTSRDFWKSKMDEHQRGMKNNRAEMSRYEDAHSKFEINKQTIADYNDFITTTIPNLEAKVNELTLKVEAAKQEFENSPEYDAVHQAAGPTIAEQKYKELQNLQEQLEQAQANLDEANTRKPQMNAARLRAEDENADPNNIYNNDMFLDAENRYNRAKERYDAASVKHDALNDKITQYNSAIDEITEINNQIQERNEALRTWDDDHKNKVIELENYWNFLQSGKAKTWRLFTKNAQEKFDSQKPLLYQNYVHDYGLAA